MNIDLIRIDGGTQARAKMSEDVIREYADALKEGAKFPPVTVFHDGENYWLADGFNRYFAHKSILRTNIDIDIKVGTKLDAKLYALGANDSHGQRRSNQDKRNAVLMALNEPAWKGWSAREIANHCAVTHTFVNNVKNSLETVSTSPKPKKTLPKVEVPDFDETDDLKETIAVLNDELEKASIAAAAGVLSEGMEEAREIMERQAKEIRTLQAECDGLRATHDTMMTEIKELKKQCAYYQKKLKATEK